MTEAFTLEEIKTISTALSVASVHVESAARNARSKMLTPLAQELEITARSLLSFSYHWEQIFDLSKRGVITFETPAIVAEFGEQLKGISRDVSEAEIALEYAQVSDFVEVLRAAAKKAGWPRNEQMFAERRDEVAEFYTAVSSARSA